jgi:signal transduction histidine kinase
MSAQEGERPLSPWLTLAVLIVTMLGFVGATVLAQRIARSVNDAAISIATNASPAIEDLSKARGELVQIAIAAASMTSSVRGADDSYVATIGAALSALHEELSHYLRQPFYPREDQRYAEVDRAVRVLEARVADLSSATGRGDRRAAVDVAHHALLPAVRSVDDAISQVIRFNVEQQRRLGLEIPRRRRHAHRIGFGLQALTAVLGLIFMTVVIRGIRDYARLLTRARAANRARDDLLATVSHDLRNPINAVTLTVRAMRRASPDAAIEQQAARIERATDRMSRLIDDLLDAAKIEAGGLRIDRKPEEVSKIVDLAAEMLRPIADEKSVHVAARPPAADAVVPCDRHLIHRVLSNIIGNAVKFSPRGGAVVVRAECLPSEVLFTVSDEGPGIPAAHRAHIFDRYWHQPKGNRSGAGLGLYIAKGIVESHGGRIWIQDGGPGTAVSFTLPFDRLDGARSSGLQHR